MCQQVIPEGKMSCYIGCTFFEEMEVDKSLACGAGEGAESPACYAKLPEPLIAEVFDGSLLCIEFAEIIYDGDEIDHRFGGKPGDGGGANVFDGLQVFFE